MNKILISFLLLLTITASAQMTKLSGLSSAKFIGSKIIFEDNREDVFGYFLLYEKDRKEKSMYELEFVLLDKNLNKLASGIFLQNRYSIWGQIMETKFLFAKKNGNRIFFSVVDIVKDGYVPDSMSAYCVRTINLTDYKVSDPYMIHNMVPEITAPENVMTGDIETFFPLRPTLNNGFLVFNESIKDLRGYYNWNKKRSKSSEEFRFYDMDLKEKWTYHYGLDDKVKMSYEYMTGDHTDMVFRKGIYNKPADQYHYTYDIIDTDTGKKKVEIELNDAKNTLYFKDIKFEEKQVIIYATTCAPNKKKIFYADQATGIAKVTYDRSTGKELSRDYFRWTDLKDKLDINAVGFVKSYGRIQLLDFQRTADGKTIVIGEGYSSINTTHILDTFVFLLDQDMKLVDYHKVEKFTNKVSGPYSYGDTLMYVGAFDYMYSQKLPGGGFVFYYTDNEKKSRRNPAWILGVITYIDGVFDFNKVTLTTKEGNIIPIIAKNGYILLREDTETDSELRLEKINY